jgi:hypothetical protein
MPMYRFICKRKELIVLLLARAGLGQGSLFAASDQVIAQSQTDIAEQSQTETTDAGSVNAGDKQTETQDDIRTIGVGMRWLAFHAQDAWVGIDVASGPEDVSWYLQMGSAW